MERPRTSSGAYPNIRVAPRFQLRMIPSRSVLTIASSDDSTMAASRRAESSDSGKLGRFIRWSRSLALATEIRQDVQTARVEPEKLGRDKRLQKFVALVGLESPQAPELPLAPVEPS